MKVSLRLKLLNFIRFKYLLVLESIFLICRDRQLFQLLRSAHCLLTFSDVVLFSSGSMVAHNTAKAVFRVRILVCIIV